VKKSVQETGCGTATKAAVEIGLLFGVPDRYRQDIITCAAVLRDPDADFVYADDRIDAEDNFQEMHAEVARWYTIISRDTEGDPRWIREAHFHILASGSTTEITKFGSLFKAELFWAARTWFRRFRNYEHALEALLAVEEMGLCTYETRMLTAACLIRVGRREEGESRYRVLISEFPRNEGVKTSFVDSLLRIGENNDALGELNEFSLSKHGSNPWVPGQYGRAYLGLHDYANAAEAFQIQIRKYSQAPSIVYIRLAQTYFRMGKRDEAHNVVADGLAVHSGDPALNTLYCANLIRRGSPSDIEKAEQILAKYADMYPRNGYILQKLVTASSLRGDVSSAIKRLNNIAWRVDPARLFEPVRITVLIAQKQFRQALQVVDSSISTNEEYGQALMRKVFLSWASSQRTTEERKRVAERALERKIPQSCQNNVPILTMHAQLARIANDDAQFEKTLRRIGELNQQAADDLSNSETLFDTWDDFDPELL